MDLADTQNPPKYKGDFFIYLPLIGGLYAPGQGALPEYDSGIYTYQNANMIVSCGIGQSSFPLRFNNRPELVIVTLRNTQ